MLYWFTSNRNLHQMQRKLKGSGMPKAKEERRRHNPIVFESVHLMDKTTFGSNTGSVLWKQEGRQGLFDYGKLSQAHVLKLAYDPRRLSRRALHAGAGLRAADVLWEFLQGWIAPGWRVWSVGEDLLSGTAVKRPRACMVPFIGGSVYDTSTFLDRSVNDIDRETRDRRLTNAILYWEEPHDLGERERDSYYESLEALGICSLFVHSVHRL
ncbi:hypothetical protein EDB92DRAFT_2105140 [Lactarius akahatsu]|uniref:Uncharacterized protein n=1 Tax=Lactarius akahatsu TaxID=416441 RepID=A0AAD4QBF4_9AGAM|nr:hypothetical protein EDB92DRAFT_2105140 [Lactarius akahatsu]